jgi:hypothetical protein
MKRIFAVLLITTALLIMSAESVVGISSSPTKLNLKGDLGESVMGSLQTTNTADVPQNMVVELKDYYMDNERNVRVYVDNDEPRGLKKWIDFKNTEILADPAETVKFEYTINIPENIAPGTYYTSIFASQENPKEEEVGVGIKGKTISLVNLTIEGDYEENLELSTFEINQQSYKKGLIEFDTTFNNTGDVLSIPKGNITIYNDKGEQVTGIYAITQIFDEQEVVTERKDEIPFNPNNISVLPESNKLIKTAWNNRQIDIGKYVAKLETYYGEDKTKIEAETDFEIVKNFQITELKAENTFQQSLPVAFNAKIKNQGTTKLTPEGYLSIKNIFGAQKERIDFTDEELVLNGGKTKSLQNLEWSSGFAFGLYNAELVIKTEGETYTKNVVFWVLSWWQIIITLAVIGLIVILIVKFIKNYNNLKKATKEKMKKQE